IASMGMAFAKNFSDLYSNSSTLNGNWFLKIADALPGDLGVLNSWSIQVYYSVPEVPISVVWSPQADLYIDAAATIPYTGQPLAIVYAKPSTGGEIVYSASSSNNQNCSTTTEVSFSVNPAPKVKILSDYCLNPGYATLIAEAEGPEPYTYNWNTGIEGNTILVDIAHDYYVSATNTVNGCVGTAVISVATELVVNGDFEQGNVGFTTDYVYYAPPGDQAFLQEEATYAVDTMASEYHTNFFGRDHTTVEQRGKFMIVNGADSNDPKVIWEQTVPVEPDTRYYYSAWAMNLNGIAPFAKLSFEVNGVRVGTVADLSVAAKPLNNNFVNINNWVRFYFGHADGWYSGTATSATIRIINLETQPT